MKLRGLYADSSIAPTLAGSRAIGVFLNTTVLCALLWFVPFLIHGVCVGGICCWGDVGLTVGWYLF